MRFSTNRLSPVPVGILLVEDNPGDVRLTREILRDGRICNTLTVAGDGVEALDILRRRGARSDGKAIDLVLLDLNLPKLNGQEVLAAIKTDPRLRQIPVNVLTTSSAEADVMRAYDQHANCYITKPVELDHLVRVIHSIEDFWPTIVRLPGE